MNTALSPPGPNSRFLCRSTMEHVHGILLEHVYGILLDEKFLYRSVHAAFGNTKWYEAWLEPASCWCKYFPPNTEKWVRKRLCENNGYGKSAMRTSVRRTTASSQTTIGTTRTTCSSPSTAPMTTLTHCTCTSTDAWRTCTETARASLFHS